MVRAWDGSDEHSIWSVFQKQSMMYRKHVNTDAFLPSVARRAAAHTYTHLNTNNDDPKPLPYCGNQVMTANWAILIVHPSPRCFFHDHQAALPLGGATSTDGVNPLSSEARRKRTTSHRDDPTLTTDLSP